MSSSSVFWFAGLGLLLMFGTECSNDSLFLKLACCASSVDVDDESFYMPSSDVLFFHSQRTTLIILYIGKLVSDVSTRLTVEEVIADVDFVVDLLNLFGFNRYYFYEELLGHTGLGPSIFV